MPIRRYYKYEGIQQAIFNSNTPTKSAIFTTDATTRGLGGARRTVSAGEGLQNTLRRLLEHSDSRENVYSPPVYAVREYYIIMSSVSITLIAGAVRIGADRRGWLPFVVPQLWGRQINKNFLINKHCKRC